MIKLILFDIDGVLIHHRDDFISTMAGPGKIDYFGILNRFHKGSLNEECDRGLKDPVEAIKPMLEKAGWNKTPLEYFESRYDFESQYIDYAILAEVEKLKLLGLRCCIASNQNCRRKDFLVKKMKLDSIFHKTYFSCDIGYIKPETAYFLAILDDIQKESGPIDPREIVFFDDLKSNVKAAKKCGISAYQIRKKADIYTSLEQLRLSVLR